MPPQSDPTPTSLLKGAAAPLIPAHEGDGAGVTSPASELLEGAAHEAQDILDRIDRAMAPPQGQPCALEVCETSILGLEQVQRLLNVPAPEIGGWLAALRIARAQMQRRLGEKLISSHAALDGKRSKYPVWVAYARYGADGHDDCTLRLMLGCAAVLAFGRNTKEKKPISSSLPQKLASLGALGPYNEQQLSLILSAQLTVNTAGLDPLLQGIATTVAGGVAAELAGGKFANGAMTAAYGYLFNEMLSTKKGTTFKSSGKFYSGVETFDDSRHGLYRDPLTPEENARNVEGIKLIAMSNPLGRGVLTLMDGITIVEGVRSERYDDALTTGAGFLSSQAIEAASNSGRVGAYSGWLVEKATAARSWFPPYGEQRNPHAPPK